MTLASTNSARNMSISAGMVSACWRSDRKDVEPSGAPPSYGRDDEKDVILNGYLAFLYPPKDSAATPIRALEQHGVSVKIVTGDNDLVARKVCSEVGQCAVVVRFRLSG
jgi:magnesium-transporting ATPase (P-type)